jgi:Hemerythrin HHE cation binding domain
MASVSPNRPQADCGKDLLTSVPSDPLGYLRLEHSRKIVLAELLEDIAADLSSPQVPVKAANILKYFARDLFLHEADEELDMVPLLLARVADRPTLLQVLRRAHAEHAQGIALVPELCCSLGALLAGIAPGVPLDFIVQAFRFIRLLRADVAWENTILLPLVQHYLTESDVQRLGAAMARRRGIAPMHPEHAAAYSMFRPK